MTTDELRAATGRLRLVHAGRPVQEVYGTTIPRGFEWMSRDEAVLADAYLREHPTDDAEPLTAEWLRAGGWKPVGDGSWLAAPGPFCDSELGVSVSFEACGRPPGCLVLDVYRDEIDLGVRTRGGVRRLLAALAPQGRPGAAG